MPGHHIDLCFYYRLLVLWPRHQLMLGDNSKILNTTRTRHARPSPQQSISSGLCHRAIQCTLKLRTYESPRTYHESRNKVRNICTRGSPVVGGLASRQSFLLVLHPRNGRATRLVSSLHLWTEVLRAAYVYTPHTHVSKDEEAAFLGSGKG